MFAKFQANIFILGRALAEKPGKRDDVIFQNIFLVFLIFVRQNKGHFFDS